MRTNTFGDNARVAAARTRRRSAAIEFDFAAAVRPLDLRRAVERFPFVPSDPAMLRDNCYEAYNIQVQGLAQRLKSTGLKRLVIGVSGGLDSTQALIVSARVMDSLGLPRANILAYTLPGFATSSGTKSNAWRLMRALGVTGAEIDIRPAAKQMLADIGHASAKGEALYDVTFENVQAGLAHRLSVPPRQPQWRAGRRHRRSVGTGARLVHLWRRRSDVALQPERARCRRR